MTPEKTVSPDRPENVTEEHLEFLDDLRETAVTNMAGAGYYLQQEFNLDRYEAREVLKYWMKTFGKEDR